MKVQKSYRSELPKSINSLFDSKASKESNSLGFILGINGIISQSNSLESALSVKPAFSLNDPNFLVVKPDRVDEIFSQEDLIGLIKPITIELTKHTNPHLAPAIEIIWIALGTGLEYLDWKKNPDSPLLPRLFKATSLVAEAGVVVGNTFPTFKVPDQVSQLSKTLDVFAISSEAVYAGRNVSIDELLALQDEKFEISIAINKLLGSLSNPSLPYQGITLQPLSSPVIDTGFKKNEIRTTI
jgi:hypothetical protein